MKALNGVTYDIGREHEHFIEWAKSKGVEINGVRAGKRPGKGLGIFASHKIKVFHV